MRKFISEENGFKLYEESGVLTVELTHTQFEDICNQLEEIKDQINHFKNIEDRPIDKEFDECYDIMVEEINKRGQIIKDLQDQLKNS
jgi:hypothetical protein